MLNNENTKTIYSKIQKQLFYMIPEKWNSIYLYASVVEKINHLETGELFFYYIPRGILKKNPVNSYEIPLKFNLEEDKYVNMAENLFSLVKDLRHEYIFNNEELWNSLTIKVENSKFLVEFDYDDEKQKEDEKHLIWLYKNLKLPLETYSKNEKKIIIKYLEQENKKEENIQKYEEPMYINPIKNIVKYDTNRVEYISAETLEKLQKEQQVKEEQKRAKRELRQIKKAEYTKNKIEKRHLKRSRIDKPKLKFGFDLNLDFSMEQETKQKLSIEDEIQMQMNAVRSQILAHN